MLVRVRPCNSYALSLLGAAQLALFDHRPSATSAAELLDNAKQSFTASIALEGSPAAGDPQPQITGAVAKEWVMER